MRFGIAVSGFAGQIPIIFAATCAWQKYFDPAALGGGTSP